MKQIYRHSYLRITLLLIILITYRNGYSQSCSGSLGDPIVNQTFGSGNNPGASLGTQTNYTYVTTDCPSDGFYAVRNSTTNCFGSSWHSLTQDHTTGDVNGYMMVVNASYTAGQFFTQTVNGLCGSSTYEFSSYIINLLKTTACTSNANRFPNITFRIETTNGTLIKTFSTGQIAGNTTPTWNRYATFFTTPVGVSTVVLKLINNAPGGCGNDLALDDIQFRPCGPTITASISGGLNVCSGNTANLSATVSAGYTTPVYQWQVGTDGTNFTDITGANALTYSTTTTGSGTKYYRMLAAENGNLANTKCRVASNVLAVNVNAIPAAPTVSSSVNLCQNGSSTTLSASGSSLLWYTAATGGTGSSTAPTIGTGTTGTVTRYVSQTVNGCESPRARIDAVVNPQLSISLTSGSITCNGAVPSGTLIVNTSGGTPTYYYSLNGGANATTNVFNNLASGTYNVVVTDSKNCTATGSFNVSTPNPLSLNASATTDCSTGTNNGVISVEAGGGTSPYIIKIDGITQSGSSPFAGQTAGSHTISITDVNGCVLSTTVTVPSVTPLSLSLSPTTCAMAGQGSITATASDGTSPYQYRYKVSSGGSFSAYTTANTITGLSPNEYTIETKDNRGCTVQSNATINLLPVAPTPAATLVNYCQNATATSLGTGLTLVSGASAVWYTSPTGGSSIPTPTPSTSTAGTTKYYVAQLLGSCESERAMIVVNVTPQPSVSATTTNACFGLSNGTITIAATSGSAPYSFSINGGASQEGSVFNNLTAGNYTATVTDINGCTANTSVTVNQSTSALGINLTAGPSTCINTAQGTISSVASGGGGSYSYKLDEGDFQASGDYTGLNAGTHTVVVKDQFGCTASNSIEFLDNPLAVASSNSPTCLVSGANTIELSAADAGNGVSYAWTGPNGYTNATMTPTIPYTSTSQNGTYQLTVTKGICTATSSVNVACSNALPIKLGSFSAITLDKNIRLAWETVLEINSDKFQVLRSTDARNFEVIGTVKAAGNTNENRSYTFSDVEPLGGISYYRLRTIDLDGTADYSKIVSVHFSENSPQVNVTNPAENGVIVVRTNNIEKAQFNLFDASGKNIAFDLVPQAANLYHLKLSQPSVFQFLILKTETEVGTFTSKILIK
ncbi:MAG: hypothetical protein ACOVOW_05715 [Spirosomataceae bacterium]